MEIRASINNPYNNHHSDIPFIMKHLPCSKAPELLLYVTPKVGVVPILQIRKPRSQRGEQPKVMRLIYDVPDGASVLSGSKAVLWSLLILGSLSG